MLKVLSILSLFVVSLCYSQDVFAQCVTTITASGSTTFCTGTTGPTLTASITPGTLLSTQWKLNGVPITGATSSTYTPTVSGSYAATCITSGNCTNTSNTITITVNTTPPAPTVSSNSPVCAGDTIGLIASIGGLLATYSWTGPNGFTATTLNPHIFPATGAHAGTYSAIAMVNGCVSPAGSTTVVITCLDSVWAGDVNYDHLVDNNDALAIALNYGATGAARTAASIAWVPQHAINWTAALTGTPGVNQKHADCNGDGLVSNTDTLAVTANYGLTHPKGLHMASAKAAGVPELYLDFTGVALVPGTTVTVPFGLGSSSIPMDHITGIAARIMFSGVTPSTAPTIDYTSGWLGTASNTLHFSKAVNNGRVDLAYARTDHHTVSGYGTLGKITFTVPSNATGKMVVYFDEVTLVDSAGAKITAFNALDDTIAITPTAVGTIAQQAPTLNIIPNPSTTGCVLQVNLDRPTALFVQISDLTGRIVWRSEVEGGTGLQTISLPAGSLSSGMYLVSVGSNQWPGIVTTKWVKEN